MALRRPADRQRIMCVHAVVMDVRRVVTLIACGTWSPWRRPAQNISQMKDKRLCPLSSTVLFATVQQCEFFLCLDYTNVLSTVLVLAFSACSRGNTTGSSLFLQSAYKLL